jgi:hypothetical protein
LVLKGRDSMASKIVTVTLWQCDVCPTTATTDAKSTNKPPGWQTQTIPLSSVLTKGIQVCPECAKNPEEAKRKAKAAGGQSWLRVTPTMPRLPSDGRGCPCAGDVTPRTSR